jgi:hypothetical protein
MVSYVPASRFVPSSLNSINYEIALATSSDVELPVEYCPGLRAVCRAIFGSMNTAVSDGRTGSSSGTGITELDLSRNNIDHHGGDLLTDYLARGRLQSLNLSDNPLGEHGGMAIMNGLKLQASLRVLTWSGGERLQNKLPSSVLVAIGRLLARPEDQIAYLDISNNISGVATRTAAATASNGSTPSTNDGEDDEEEASENGDEGCVAIALSLSRRSAISSLTHLDISNCGVGPRGIRALARALQTNATLTSLK